MGGYGLSLGGSSDCNKSGCKAGVLALVLRAAGVVAAARGATGLGEMAGAAAEAAEVGRERPRATATCAAGLSTEEASSSG